LCFAINIAHTPIFIKASWFTRFSIPTRQITLHIVHWPHFVMLPHSLQSNTFNIPQSTTNNNETRQPHTTANPLALLAVIPHVTRPKSPDWLHERRWKP
jgi:hypothetical protein